MADKEPLRAFKALSFVGLFPHKLFLYNPLKILEYDEMMRLANISADDRVLDIGCGRGLQTLLMAKRAKKVVGADISEASISKAKEYLHVSRLERNVDFVATDILKASFAPGDFDKIVSFSVLEHIPAWEEILRMTKGWLSPQGKLVISVDSLSSVTRKELIEKHRERSGVAHYFDERGLKEALERAGYKNVMVIPILRSALAEKILADTVEKNLNFTLLSGYSQYRGLRRAERKTPQGSGGIFLIAIASPS